MADEVRRSVRSTKGQHTKNADALDEALLPKTKPKSAKKDKHGPPDLSRSQSATSHDHEQEEEGEDDAIYRCVCGDQREIRGREMIMCDRCEAWQHNKCLGLPDSSYWEDKTYLCEQCKPEDHQELLAAIARGEKPWNRKKGSKAARPKFRPSDVASQHEATPERKTPLTTPAHTQPPTPTQAAPPAPPLVAPEQPQQPASTKGSRKSSIKSEPQSPVREKRPLDAGVDRDHANAKRRKSSAPQAGKTAHGAVQNIEDLPPAQKKLTEALMKHMADLIKAAADTGRYRIPDGETPTSVATALSLKLDHALASHYGAPVDNNSGYALQHRRIVYNMKHNPDLLDKLLNGSLTSEELAVMSSDDMATAEKLKELQAMKEAIERQSLLTEEAGPRLRKTHKGEEWVGTDNMDAEPPQFTSEVPAGVEDGKSEPKLPTPNHDVPEIPEHIPTSGTPLSTESGAAAQGDSIRRQSNFDLTSVLSKVKSPPNADHQAFAARRQSSMKTQQPRQEGPQAADAELDRLLQDEDGDVEMTGLGSDPSIVWRGNLDMHLSGKFDAVARFVAGGDLGEFIPWNQLLRRKAPEGGEVRPEDAVTLPILGRIESQRGNDYIEGLSATGIHDVGVLAVTPVNDEGQAVFDRMHDYFNSRKRWGVVPPEKMGHDALRDMYLVPVEQGGDELPGFMNMFKYCSIETPRAVPLLLLVIVAKLPEEAQKPPSPPNLYQPPGATAAQEIAATHAYTNGAGSAHVPAMAPPVPSPSPHTNPHAPSYSPMQHNFPPNPAFAASGSPAYPTPTMPPMHNGFAPPHQQHHNGYQPQAPPAPHMQHPQHQQPPHPAPQQPQQASPPQVSPKAIEILGPFIDCNVVRHILSVQRDITDEQLRNLRAVVEKEPAARDDMNAFAHHLGLKMQQQQQAQAQGAGQGQGGQV